MEEVMTLHVVVAPILFFIAGFFFGITVMHGRTVRIYEGTARELEELRDQTARMFVTLRKVIGRKEE